VVTGEAQLEGVKATRLGLLAMAAFLGPVDLRNAQLPGTFDARFASFAKAAQLRGLELGSAAYLGGARFDGLADLSAMHGGAERVNLNGVHFLDRALLDDSNLPHGATLEGARFDGPASLTRLRVRERLSLSRAELRGELRLDESDLEGLDAFGARFLGPVSMADVRIRANARFALDGGQRRRHLESSGELHRLYRLYQGDEDADPASFAGPAYGVQGPDDLTSAFAGAVSFANLTVDGRLVLEGVRFGAEGAPASLLFYGARIQELHLERAEVHGRLDLSTLAGHEVAMNRMHLDGALVLDECNIAGRLSLADATLGAQSTLSFWGASIGAFQIARGLVERKDGSHALFYERCAAGQIPDAAQDPRLQRDATLGDPVRAICFDHTLDEYSTLQDAFAKQAQPADHDWAYWYQRHHATARDLREGDLPTRASALVQWVVFENGFGWGVRLGNILITALVLSLIFSFIYRAACHDTEVKFNGEIHVLKNMSQLALFTMSLQSIIGANIGWEVMGKDRRFKYVNTVLTIIGIILITFFVGAYTRMVLA
jgi:hypothetical protein